MTSQIIPGRQPASPPDDTRAAADETTQLHLTTGDVWRRLERASFAILAHADPSGEPRSSGVVYGTAGRRLYVAVAPSSRKAREIADGQLVSLTVPVRRGGLLALLFPIPPATITFRARAIAHPAGSLNPASVSKAFARLLPESRRLTACVLELVPEGRFLAFGIGVSLAAMTRPETATARVPVA
jgi:hypothetical protein